MRIALLALLCSLSLPTLANPYADMSAPELRRAISEIPAVFQENWYQIEILAFARKQPVSDEYWRLDQQPDLNRSALIRLDSESPQAPEHADNVDQQAIGYGAWKTLEGALPLTNTKEQMNRAGDRILLHQAWRQPVRERAHAFAVLIEGGNVLPAPMVIAEPDDDANAAAPDSAVLDSRGQITSLPKLETEEEGITAVEIRELQGALRFHLSRYLHLEPLLWYGSDTDSNQRVWVKIDQNRRMRSEELHYLDHPLFGLLVRITPWKHPEQKKLDELNAALKSKETR
ncbi:MAG: hypothetical protein KAG82_07265 [Alcanivoracaceae bacterium]|jgi:hypothetical protein|nr:hypothetical protein [Alcanivoracaceae bacterium]